MRQRETEKKGDQGLRRKEIDKSFIERNQTENKRREKSETRRNEAEAVRKGER